MLKLHYKHFTYTNPYFTYKIVKLSIKGIMEVLKIKKKQPISSLFENV